MENRYISHWKIAFKFTYFSMYPKPCIQKKTTVLCMSLRTILFWLNNWNGCDQTGKQSNSFFPKKFLRAFQGLEGQHILRSKTLFPYLFLVMWSKRNYFILRSSLNSWLSLITPHNPLNWSHSPSVLESDTIPFVIIFQEGKHQWLVLAFHN